MQRQRRQSTPVFGDRPRRIQRALFRRGPSAISFDELLIGIVALDPTTASTLGDAPAAASLLDDFLARDPARGAGMAALLSPLGVNYTFALRQYHSDLKRDAANAFLRALPADAWAISADADEFFRFPSNMEKLVRDEAPGHDGIFATYFAERIGANFSFPPLRAAPSIAEQFPIECAGFRAALLPNFNAQDYKTALFRVRDRAGRTRQIAGSHALAPEFYKTPRGGAVNPRYLPFVPHFSFFGGPPGSGSFIDLALHKQEVYMSASPPRAVVYTKTLELFDLDHWRAAGEVRLSPAGRQRCEALCELAPGLGEALRLRHELMGLRDAC